jgi:hypothetical protein
MEITIEKRKEMQKAWVLTLINEETPQEKTILASNDGQRFCCLGDAMRVAIGLGADWVPEKRHSRLFYFQKTDSDTSCECYLPNDVVENWLHWTGVGFSKHGANSGEYSLGRQPVADEIVKLNLSDMNDRGLSKRILGVIAFALYTPDLTEYAELKSKIREAIISVEPEKNSVFNHTDFQVIALRDNYADAIREALSGEKAKCQQ